LFLQKLIPPRNFPILYKENNKNFEIKKDTTCPFGYKIP
jgi:hypothetical protein